MLTRIKHALYSFWVGAGTFMAVAAIQAVEDSPWWRDNVAMTSSVVIISAILSFITFEVKKMEQEQGKS